MLCTEYTARVEFLSFDLLRHKIIGFLVLFWTDVNFSINKPVILRYQLINNIDFSISSVNRIRITHRAVPLRWDLSLGASWSNFPLISVHNYARSVWNSSDKTHWCRFQNLVDWLVAHGACPVTTLSRWETPIEPLWCCGVDLSIKIQSVVENKWNKNK